MTAPQSSERIIRRRASPKKSRSGQGQGRRASGIDLLAIAEAVLFPGIAPEALTSRQVASAAKVAKAHLVELGQWPESTSERHEHTLAADLLRSRRREA